jgi:hypothetical protein
VKNDSRVDMACNRFAFAYGWRCTADGGSVSIPSSAMRESSSPPSGKLVLQSSGSGDGSVDLSVVETDSLVVWGCVTLSSAVRAPLFSIVPLTWWPALLIASAMVASSSSGARSWLALGHGLPSVLLGGLVGVTEFIVAIPMRAKVELVLIDVG